MLNGSWNLERKQFLQAPPSGGQPITYGILVVGGRDRPSADQLGVVSQFQGMLENDSQGLGVRLRLGGAIVPTPADPARILACLEPMIRGNARIVVCVMMDDDCYGMIKLEADRKGIATQCVKFKKIQKFPRGYTANVMLKVNAKLGGTNHTLTSRISAGGAGARGTGGVFQDPPASLSWIFDRPCMLVGIDVCHGETQSSNESVAAVVASLDGRASQYAAHVSVQGPRVEIVNQLSDAMVSLFNTFKSKNNGNMPSTVIVYRDGVSEGQFEQVTNNELRAIKDSVAQMGYMDSDVKIAMVICQKGHNTRLVYEESPKSYINPCPGLCIDASGGENSIASARLNEFYLNSHAAIQGTSKPCKYTLVHDEVGFKLAELELLTYWTTYLYVRANKSVSYAAPAYYAHWASKRGKYLTAAGGSAADLQQISSVWGAAGRHKAMFFV